MHDQAKVRKALEAAGWMANIAGQIVGEDLNKFSNRGELGVSVAELAVLLPNLKLAVQQYNKAIIDLSFSEENA